MKRNVTIAGAQYTGVPSVLIPLTGSNDKAVFCEVSDTTATAEDVANGKIFYTADGTATTGTATGGKTVTPQFKVNITQSDNQTISCSSVTTAAPTLNNGVISITPDLFAANFIVTPTSGYDAGTLSETSHKFSTWGETVNISATAATKHTSIKQSGHKFTINKNNCNNPIELTLSDSNKITINGTSANLQKEISSDINHPTPYLFSINNLPDLKGLMFIVDYSTNMSITSSMFQSGGTFYTYFCNVTTKITREKDGYGLFWSFPDLVRNGYAGGVAAWYYSSASAASETSDNPETIWTNLYTSYTNGESLVVEFTDE